MIFDTVMEIQNCTLATTTKAFITKDSRVAKEFWVMMDAPFIKACGLMVILSKTWEHIFLSKWIQKRGSIRWSRCLCSQFWWWISPFRNLYRKSISEKETKLWVQLMIPNMSKSKKYSKNAQQLLWTRSKLNQKHQWPCMMKNLWNKSMSKAKKILKPTRPQPMWKK